MRWARLRHATLIAWLAGAASAGASPLDLPCEPVEAGRVYCATNDQATRVGSFDGTPLDVDLSSPVTTAPTPLVVMRHGYGGGRNGSKDPEVHWWVDHGYRVLTYAARGHGRSGDVAHWVDPRYEPRDTQFLVGRLVDQGLVDPDRIAVLGGSYGGGQTATLAILNDRVMLEDGTLVPWRSPGGVPLHVAAAVPTVGWTDLAESLAPDGRELDYAEIPAPASRPAGVPLQSWTDLLSGSAIPLDDATRSVFSAWTSSTGVLAASRPARATHSPVALYDGHRPAPTLFAHGWDDELFPLREATRAFDYYRAAGAPVRIAVSDYGHGRAQSKGDDSGYLVAEGRAWIEHYVRGVGPAPAQEVAYRTMTCPLSAPSSPLATLPGPLDNPGEVRLGAGSGGFDERGGDGAAAYDPLFGRPFCERRPNAVAADNVLLRGDTARGGGYTLVGAPTVSGDFRVAGPDAQVDARLFDESDDGHLLVTRGVWRPVAGHGVFQLHAGGWHFAAGHRPVLELLGADRGYLRASPLPFRVDVDGLAVRLPVSETIGSADGQVTRPLPFDVPAGYRLSPAGVARQAGLDALPALAPTATPNPSPAPTATPAPTVSPAPLPTIAPLPPARVALSVRRPSRPKARRQTYRLTVTSTRPVASVIFSGPGTGVRARRTPFRATFRVTKPRRLRRIRFVAVATLKDGRQVTATRRVRLPAR